MSDDKKPWEQWFNWEDVKASLIDYSEKNLKKEVENDDR